MANEQHLEIIRQGVATWNEWRKNNPTFQPDLSHADLSNVDLSGAYLVGADLHEVTLIGTNLSHANLSEANLREAHLGNANLTNADLSRAYIEGAYLREANLHGANLGRANLTAVNLEKACLTEANLREANLQGAGFLFEFNRAFYTIEDSGGYAPDPGPISGKNEPCRGVHCRGADFSKAILGKARLSGADLRQTKICGADLSAADLTEVDLSDADLSGANLSDAIVSGANLRQASLCQANLERVSFEGANLERSNLDTANLEGADLRNAKLKGVALQKAASLIGVNLSGQNLSGQNFSGYNLHKASFNETDLQDADLSEANLSEVTFEGADLHGAKLNSADLRGANLNRTALTRTDFSDADLTGSSIYGIAAWDLTVTSGTRQENLIITPPGTSAIAVDNIKVAQFIYLLLNNQEMRDVIDAIVRKGVLLLGRFTDGRLAVLERLQAELRKRGFVPMVFNFDKPEVKDITETVRLLAGMSHFVIADITSPRSTPLELQATVPECMIPFVPIIENGEKPFAMFRDLWIKYRDWVFEPISYPSVDRLIEVLDEEIIRPAQERFSDLLARKAETLRVKDI